MERIRPLQQVYNDYTKEDFEVWKTLFNRQSQLIARYGSNSYREALTQIGFTADAIPRFQDINQRLEKTTGWQLVVVQGHIPPEQFFEMLAEKIFPATCWLRTFAELDYIEEPDMFHDVFGHVPLLINQEYANFMQAFGQLALECHNDPEKIAMLSRIYWFTIEFGLIKEAGAEKIYGAGILSSPGETTFSMSSNAQRPDFDTALVLQTSFRTDVIQERYFVIAHFDQLNRVLETVRSFFKTMVLAQA
jgi:phenylalanine-4-hydroxylase